MNENLKEKLNIIARSLFYIFLISMSFRIKDHYSMLNFILIGKTVLDTYILADFIELFQASGFNAETDLSSDIWDSLLGFSGIINYTFFMYFYAKICGLYKKLQKYNFWIKSLIFLLIPSFAYLISTYDLKTLKPYKVGFEIDVWYYIFPIFSAFLLNIFLNFLTKKFPIPFEKIGYWCSIEFFKDLIKKIKI